LCYPRFVPRTTTLTEAFAFFDTAARNVRWGWSAISADGRTVAVTLWDHERAADGSVDFFDPIERERWRHHLGNRDRIKNLRHAIEHCDGKFRVVRVVAKDINAYPRQIKQRIADPDTVMQITRFDEETGEFAARPV
jgi:hypothetical protein